MGLAVVEQEVFLGVVEVRLQGDAGVGFEERGTGAAEVDAIVLGACLEEDAERDERGEGQCGEEIVQECSWNGRVSCEEVRGELGDGWRRAGLGVYR